MTPAERARAQQWEADRQAVLARMADPAVLLGEQDEPHMTNEEVRQYAKVGRFDKIGAVKKLRRG